MDKKRLLKHLVLLMFFIFTADLLAKSFYWYFSIWSFDMFMHFLGGLWVGLFFIYIFFRKKEASLPAQSYLKILLLVLLVGILWEVFEFYMNVVSGTTFDPLDTLSDILLDMLGAVVSILYFIKIIRPVPKTGK